MKSYGQQCAVALALDLIGDRWTLLIVRELMVSSGSRYTDLQNGLSGIASNLLSNRLREMELNGLIYRENAPPPIATTLFRLTERGKALAPVLAAAGAWGMPLLGPLKVGAVFRSSNLKLPLQLYLTTHSKSTKPITLLIQTGDEPLTLQIARGRTTVQSLASTDADLTVSGGPHAVLGLLLKRLSIADARKSGLRLKGDLSVLDQIVTRWLPA